MTKLKNAACVKATCHTQKLCTVFIPTQFLYQIVAPMKTTIYKKRNNSSLAHVILCSLSVSNSQIKQREVDTKKYIILNERKTWKSQDKKQAFNTTKKHNSASTHTHDYANKMNQQKVTTKKTNKRVSNTKKTAFEDHEAEEFPKKL